MKIPTIWVERSPVRVHRVVLVREGEPDVDLSDLFSITEIRKTVRPGDVPVVTVDVIGVLHEQLAT